MSVWRIQKLLAAALLLALTACVPGGGQPTETAAPAVERPATQAPSHSETERAREYDLRDALRRKLIQVQINGLGLETVSLEIASKSNNPLVILIPAGTVFKPVSPHLQKMVVRIEQRIDLPPATEEEPSKWIPVPVAALNMKLATPGPEDELQVDTPVREPDLKKLLALSALSAESFRVQQFAIWTITENPFRSGFASIEVDAAGNIGPTDAEIKTIIALFKQAGIATGKYRGLN